MPVLLDKKQRTMNPAWKQARSIFHNSAPPREVWEKQFDFFNDELQRLCSTAWQEIDFADLWFYYHDLAYVELQPEVFSYLFPVCLMAWQDTLTKNVSCASGDAEFHYAVHQGKVFDKMLKAGQKDKVFQFFKDAFITRLDQERGFIYLGSKTPAYGWMCRFNSLGIVMPRIDLLWESWWTLETPGRAVAAIQYISGLVYPPGHNVLFPAWTPEHGGGEPPLLAHDSRIVDSGWMKENTDFLHGVLSREFVVEKLRDAVTLLAHESEHELARQVERDLPRHLALVERRVEELPVLLGRLDISDAWCARPGEN
ncbi:MAG: hypothetical protein JW818_09805 [Pirellulales bacterium]|nr:hypothetical protein [Pirellulales bacterium]